MVSILCSCDSGMILNPCDAASGLGAVESSKSAGTLQDEFSSLVKPGTLLCSTSLLPPLPLPLQDKHSLLHQPVTK